MFFGLIWSSWLKLLGEADWGDKLDDAEWMEPLDDGNGFGMLKEREADFGFGMMRKRHL